MSICLDKVYICQKFKSIEKQLPIIIQYYYLVIRPQALISYIYTA